MTVKKDYDLLQLLSLFIIGILILIFGTIYNGYALTVLWAWFAVPIFELPALTIPQAIGISLIVRYITAQLDLEEKKDDLSLGLKAFRAGLLAILFPSVFLGFGWIITLFI